MRAKFVTVVFLLLALGLGLLPSGQAAADTGPKPTMTFEFTQAFAGPPVTISAGSMLECQQADCSDGQPLKQLGPQHFSCTGNSCDSLGYGYSSYLQLEIQFSDGKTRRSNVFQQAGFNSSYRVTIRADDLLVEAIVNPSDLFSSPPPYLYVVPCCCCLLGLLVLAIVIVVILRRNSKQP